MILSRCGNTFDVVVVVVESCNYGKLWLWKEVVSVESLADVETLLMLCCKGWSLADVKINVCTDDPCKRFWCCCGCGKVSVGVGVEYFEFQTSRSSNILVVSVGRLLNFLSSTTYHHQRHPGSSGVSLRSILDYPRYFSHIPSTTTTTPWIIQGTSHTSVSTTISIK